MPALCTPDDFTATVLVAVVARTGYNKSDKPQVRGRRQNGRAWVGFIGRACQLLHTQCAIFVEHFLFEPASYHPVTLTELIAALIHSCPLSLVRLARAASFRTQTLDPQLSTLHPNPKP